MISNFDITTLAEEAAMSITEVPVLPTESELQAWLDLETPEDFEEDWEDFNV